MDNNEYNSPYVPKPGAESGGQRIQPYTEVNSMAKAAYTIGIVGVISLITMLVYPALIMGSTAIILALLSRDREGKMHSKAKSAITSGIVAITVDALLVVMTVTVLFSDGPLKQEFNSTFKDIYGQTFDDMWEDMQDGSFDLPYRNLPYGNQFNSQLPSDGGLDYNKSNSTESMESEGKAV